MTSTKLPIYKVHYKMPMKRIKLGSFFIKGKNTDDVTAKSKIHLSSILSKEDLKIVVLRVSRTTL